MPADREHPANLPTRLTLISHAATNALRHAAFPLNEALEEGSIRKISRISWNAPRAQRVLSGPERRTQQTAQALGLSAITTAELRDCDYGAWRGRSFEELQADQPEGIVAWLTDPAAAPHGGESIASLIERVGHWMDDGSVEGHTVAVTHPAVVRSAIIHALNAPAQSFWRIDIAPLSITDLRFNGRVWTLRLSACPLSNFEEEV
jgi:broad specificity phosphatase PhoE